VSREAGAEQPVQFMAEEDFYFLPHFFLDLSTDEKRTIIMFSFLVSFLLGVGLSSSLPRHPLNVATSDPLPSLPFAGDIDNSGKNDTFFGDIRAVVKISSSSTPSPITVAPYWRLRPQSNMVSAGESEQPSQFVSLNKT